ncbi:parB-like nuclease domain protein [Asticcacaulis biprosthecium C19]|uniref:ParB-like nuclease domain protein n=1 Tax=Asticcacaulis biprosthecium C19 TaxID=715226 RepID=F4QGD2_9CAUL|nr:ParB N-terminal domain-containing protein [Asticcacaulis biprosthecium]EGF92460.1 parB-like nuclease domain protein [Asticcacaulis biprosthecium C19]
MAETAQALAEVLSANPERLDQVQLIRISDIDDSDRLRPLDMQVVEGLAASMAREGLLHPIDICQLPNQKSGKPYRLVCGGHRLGGAKWNQWDVIPAFVRSSGALDRMSRELAENFFRAELSPLDQAAFVAKLIETEKARLGIAPEADGRALNSDYRSAKVSKKQMTDDLCNVHKSMGLQESVATRLGFDRSTVSRHLALNAIAPSFLDRVRKLPIAGNASALRQLAKLDFTDQAKALDVLEADLDKGGARDIGKAIAIVKDTTPPDPEKKRLGAFIGAFERMGRRERMAALMALASMMPKGVEIKFQDSGEQVQAATDAARLSGRGLAGIKEAAE